MIVELSFSQGKYLGINSIYVDEFDKSIRKKKYYY